ncbi:hypothetical protein [Helicobacter labacensis]|uniref:hypothetical protein n=1 Tax=Helicobacter labacensis TaxID=2316079 RepID=UPI001F45050C|nr:hypothetical protein [Helicobacter labacensis]
MFKDWHAICCGTQGQNKPYCACDFQIAILVLVTGVARFSHLGASRLREAVAQDLRANFARYTETTHPTSQAIAEHIQQTLQELAKQHTTTLQQDKDEIEDILQAILEEVQAVQTWQQTWHLPLLNTTQTLQERLQADQEQRQNNAQELISTALAGLKTEIRAWQETSQGKHYQLGIGKLVSALKNLKDEVAKMCFTLVNLKQAHFLEQQYQALAHSIKEARTKNKRWLKRCWHCLFGSKARKQAQAKLQTLQDAFLPPPPPNAQPLFSLTV